MEVIFRLRDIGRAAKRVLAMANGYNVFAIRGDMGVGKTTFIFALCKVMGVQDHLSSPTFSLINQYSTPEGGTIYHMDLYRLNDEREAISSGVEDCLYSGNTCFVEWPERAPGIFPEKTLQVYIMALNSYTRKMVIDKL